jgi:hypothetical protein
LWERIEKGAGFGEMRPFGKPRLRWKHNFRMDLLGNNWMALA